MDWVLLRGLARSSGHWGRFYSHFEGYCQGNVISVDLPGFGEFAGQPSPDSIAMITQHVFLQINHRLGRKHSIGVIGISMGGMVATELAALHPDWVKHLVLINTSSRGSSKFYQRVRPAAYSALVRALLFSGTADSERIIYRLTCNRTELCEATVAQWQQINKNYPFARGSLFKQFKAALKYCGQTIPPCKSTLILASAQDHLVNPQCSINLAKAWQVACQIHPAAGHDLPHDDPQWLISQIDCWLSGNQVINK